MKQLTKEFIAACEGNQDEVASKLDDLNLDYLKCSHIKRDILDNGLYENYSKNYEILFPLILKYRDIELERLKQALNSKLKERNWGEKLAYCKEQIHANNELFKNSIKNGDSIPDENLYDDIYYEEVRDYNNEYGRLACSFRDPTCLYDKFNSILKERSWHIEMILSIQMKELEALGRFEFQYLSYDQWIEKLNNELYELNEGKRIPFLIKLRGLYEVNSYSYGEISMSYDLFDTSFIVNDWGEAEEANKMLNTKMLISYIDHLLQNPPSFNKKKPRASKIKYLGDPRGLINGFRYYNNEHWEIDDIEAFVYTYFEFNREYVIPESVSKPTYKVKGQKNALTKVIRDLVDRGKILDEPAENAKWLDSIINPNNSKFGAIRQNFQKSTYADKSQYYDKPLSRIKIDIIHFR